MSACNLQQSAAAASLHLARGPTNFCRSCCSSPGDFNALLAHALCVSLRLLFIITHFVVAVVVVDSICLVAGNAFVAYKMRTLVVQHLCGNCFSCCCCTFIFTPNFLFLLLLKFFFCISLHHGVLAQARRLLMPRICVRFAYFKAFAVCSQYVFVLISSAIVKH